MSATPLERCLSPHYEEVVREAARQREIKVGVARFREALKLVVKDPTPPVFTFVLDGRKVDVSLVAVRRP